MAIHKRKPQHYTDEQKERHRRRLDKGVVGIADATRTKGISKAIQECKKRKEVKHHNIAKSLKQYRKVMKREGYDAGKGAGRRRGGEEAVADEAKDTKSTTTPSKYDTGSKKKKQQKENPFKKSMQRALDKQKQRADAEELDKQNEKDKRRKLKDRRKRTSAIMTQRTKRGQPIMKQVVEGLLMKLEKQK